ncbi:uncharacterized protein BDR25DRAFT_42190 [Lindgomyces ingoldianus]|uniref:Uncharacterized protein n=1 Tax=Lindgomyces ingoldianus TaxID=673940 RepID=A0ACB6REI3_9PLEO|nr:uncharacterized protein BDR25DRAFT_42190 [Lindgomyces ingoldianus]KAF2476922.1 hypothetical protein BDR25DRAFT_42190 [Lindgomyces ingoldianus]
MVSRGGRSRGCEQCRRRRVKCDETRPVCNRCTKRGIDCNGPKDATWINQNAALPLRHTSNRPVTTSPTESQLVRYSSSISPNISLTAFEENIYISYTRKVLFKGGPVALACDMVQLDTQSTSVSETPGLALLRNAVVSLAVTFYGSQHHQPKITTNGYQLYGSTLRQLNIHLSKPQLQTTDETILTVFTCLLLEIFLPTGKNHFLRHIRGLESILELRGPPTSTSGSDSFVLAQGLRLASIFGGLAMSTPSIYSRDEWKRSPSIESNKGEILRHRLFDVLADCTRLLSERNTVLSLGGAESRQRLLKETRSLLEELKSLRDLWASLNAGRLTNVVDGPDNQPKSRLTVANHGSATLLMLYNATLIFITDILLPLDSSTDYRSMRHAAAMEIVYCLDTKSFTKREAGAYSNSIGHIAVKVAWKVLGGFNSPEGRKLSRLVKAAIGDVFAVGAWADEAWNAGFEL